MFDGIEPTPLTPAGALITWPNGETSHVAATILDEAGRETPVPPGTILTLTGEKDARGLPLTTDGHSLRLGLF
ncbi:MAG: hypothetical protein GDA49_05570 [Rhodospirillales bacterium]|nr:hypothetical protein [Rhodospirillales bacterium]